jgi:hypothetical protein
MRDSKENLVARGTTPPIMIIDSRKRNRSSAAQRRKYPTDTGDMPNQRPYLPSHEAFDPDTPPLSFSASHQVESMFPLEENAVTAFTSTAHDDDRYRQPLPPNLAPDSLGPAVEAGIPSPPLLQTVNTIPYVPSPLPDPPSALPPLHAQVVMPESGSVTGDARVVSPSTPHEDSGIAFSSSLSILPQPQPAVSDRVDFDNSVSLQPADPGGPHLMHDQGVINLASFLTPQSPIAIDPPPQSAPDADNAVFYPVNLAPSLLDPAPPPQASLLLPHILRINPKSGPITGGTEVDLLGSNFPRDAFCLFEQAPALTEWFNETVCLCISPPSITAGTVEVKFGGVLAMGATRSFTYVDTRENDMYVPSPYLKSIRG